MESFYLLNFLQLFEIVNCASIPEFRRTFQKGVIQNRFNKVIPVYNSSNNLLRRVVVRYPHHTTLQTSQDFFKNLEKWARIENGLNKRFCYQDRRTEKKVLFSKSHVVINRQKYIYGISWVRYFLQ